MQHECSKKGTTARHSKTPIWPQHGTFQKPWGLFSGASTLQTYVAGHRQCRTFVQQQHQANTGILSLTKPAESLRTPCLSGTCLCREWALLGQLLTLLPLSASTAVCVTPVFPVCWSPSSQLLLPVLCNLQEKKGQRVTINSTLARISIYELQYTFLATLEKLNCFGLWLTKV